MTTHLEELSQKIQAAVAAQPELTKQLNACTSKADLAVQLSKALSAPISTADLDALERHNKSDDKADMSDAQLDAVAGGAESGYYFHSLLIQVPNCLYRRH
jgi:hypothetical protein